MKKLFLLIPCLTTMIITGYAGESPYNYFNVNFGLANYKSPLIYNYSLEYLRDINICKRSSILFGVEWENFYQHEEFKKDTNFVSNFNFTGFYDLKYYSFSEKTMAINVVMAYKHWLKRSKNSSIYLQSEINFNFDIRKVTKAKYYYRDTAQTLYPGPYLYKYIEKDPGSKWFPDNIRPALSFGYLRNINKNLAYHFKLDLILAFPDQNPRGMTFLYPKLGFGLAFR